MVIMLEIKSLLFYNLFNILICGVISAKICTNIVPGLDRLGQGVDLTKLDIFHDYTVDNLDGFVNSIIDYHCNENKTWVSPYDNVTYQIPDEINRVISLPSGVIISEVETQVNVEEVKESLSLELGIEGCLGVKKLFCIGMFSDSLTLKQSQYTITNTSKFVAKSKALVSVSQIYFIPSDFLNNSLNKYAHYYINKLSDKYEDDPQSYIQFLQTYGTHYFENANFGGTLTIWFEIEKYLKQVMSEMQIELNAESSFLKILKAHGAFDGDVADVDQLFIDNSQHKERYFGGIANLFESEGYKAWWPTVARNPWIYSGNLRPISDLITGPKKAELIKASQVYLDYNYLNEMQRTLYTFIGKHYAGENIALDYVNQVNQQLNLTVPDHHLISLLYDNISAYVLTPNWFNYDTLLCVDWFGEQCAPIHVETPLIHPCQSYYNCPEGSVYFSNPLSPDWFSQVTFVVILDYCTHPYAWIECNYYFALNVPASLPGWVRNLKFCAYNRQGCGDTTEKMANQSILSLTDIEQCVPPNTPTYPDSAFSTDEGGDKCGQLYFKISTI